MHYKSKKVQDRRIVSIEVNTKLYMIYQMVMYWWPWVTLNSPNHPNFCIFRCHSYLCSGSTYGF